MVKTVVSPYSYAGMDFKLVGKISKEKYYEQKQTVSQKLEDDFSFIFSVIYDVTRVDRSMICGKSRLTHIRQARQLFHFFAKKYTSASLEVIGAKTNNSHCTVLNSLKRVEDDKELIESVKETFKKIDDRLKMCFD